MNKLTVVLLYKKMLLLSKRDYRDIFLRVELRPTNCLCMVVDGTPVIAYNNTIIIAVLVF